MNLILTVGLPRSGKTTWALKQGHPIVSSDAIRLATHGRRFWAPMEKTVWATAWQMVAALFHAGHENVIVDACHTSQKRRDFWMSPGMGDHPDWPCWSLYFQIIDTAKEECLRRAGDDSDIVDAIERMSSEAEWPIERAGAQICQRPLSDSATSVA